MKKGILIMMMACCGIYYGQTQRTFGINTYTLPTEKGVIRYDKTYNEDGAYSMFYSAIVGDSIFVVREQFEIKNEQPVMTAVYIEHFGTDNENVTYYYSPIKSDFEEGHAETWSILISAKNAEGKTAWDNGHKWMIYPPNMPAYKESLGPGTIRIFFGKRSDANHFHEEITVIFGESQLKE
ncbi:MAG: hypothetical protein IT221_12140 [Fluviicola sp.]|nr:hypothetical protein [Fluviicola sp.]